MEKDKIKFAKIFHECRKQAIKEIKTCYHPNCKLPSINSHILQRNGILSSIAKDNHLWEHKINHFKDPYFFFKRTGIKEIFSFKCFCKTHDDKLFKKIEGDKIDFSEYDSLLLFTLRTIYNERYRKEVNIRVYELLIEKGAFKKENEFHIKQNIEQEKLGIQDIKKNEVAIWSDLDNKTESFVFGVRKLTKMEICLSAFYNYETTLEMNLYRMKFGKEMESISSIFINMFPYEDHSILLMAYNKNDEQKVKPYFYTFFKESEKRVQRKLTNLFLFACETWVVSDEFYNSKFKGIEDIIAFATTYMINLGNERLYFPLNFCSPNFKSDMKNWRSTVVK